MDPNYLGQSSIVIAKALIHDAQIGNGITGSRRAGAERQEENAISWGSVPCAKIAVRATVW